MKGGFSRSRVAANLQHPMRQRLEVRFLWKPESE
jgi:hypothetical protein